MNENIGLGYSDNALLSRYFFYKDINDINIFVEDKDKEYEYETIFERMFESKYCIKSIIAVGGKLNLEKAYNKYGKYDKENRSKINVYIADGDFDRIIDIKMIDDQNFIYLESYNIENYFIDKKAAYLFAKGKLKRNDEEVKEMVDFDKWKEKIVEQSFKLFLLYSAIKKYHPSTPSVSRNEYLFINQKDGFETPGAYDKLYLEISGIITDLDDKLEKIKEKYYNIYRGENSNIICGKFLQTSLYEHIRNLSRKTFTKDDFRWHLLCNFDINKLGYVKNRIDSIQETS